MRAIQGNKSAVSCVTLDGRLNRRVERTTPFQTSSRLQIEELLTVEGVAEVLHVGQIVAGEVGCEF